MASYTPLRRPRRSRMYDYNYEYAASYYKPQTKYIGETVDPPTRRSRRHTVSPPGAKTFSERWAADPFYGRVQRISEWVPSASVPRGRSRLVGASSYPDLSVYPEYEEEAMYRGGRAKSVARVRARSVSQERSVAVVRSERARSVSRARSVFQGDFEDSRSVRAGSYYEPDTEFYPLSDEEWERVLQMASREEREKSIYQLRMSLENPIELPKKKMMKTTVGHGIYQNSLYGTFTWDPAPYLSSGRQ